MKPIKKPDRPSGKKKWAVILSIILFFLVIGSLYLFIHQSEKRIKIAVIELLNRELSDESEILIEHFNLSLVPLGFTARNIELFHHTSYENREPKKQLDLMRSLKVQELSLKKFRLWQFIKERTIQFDSIIITGADTEIVSGVDIESEKTGNDDPLPPIFISELNLLDSNLSIFHGTHGKDIALNIKNYSVLLLGIELSDPGIKAVPQFQNLDLQIQKLDFFTQNGHYELQTDSIHLNSSDNLLKFKNIHLNPLLSATAKAEEAGHQIDRFEITLSHFQMMGLDLKKWLYNGHLNASKIDLNELQVQIDRDRSYPRRDRDEDRILPPLQFKQLDIPIQIDTLHAISGSLSYHEYYSENGREGFVQFDNIDLKAFPFQNISNEDSLFVRAEARFMNQSELALNIDFSLENDGAHIVSGTLGPMDLTTLNEPMDDLIFLRINSGELDQLNFWFYADNSAAAGNMIMVYRNLEIRFLDEEAASERRRDRFRSFIANTFAIRSNNPPEDPRTGEIQYNRDPDRSMFSYWLRSLAAGLEDSVKRL